VHRRTAQLPVSWAREREIEAREREIKSDLVLAQLAQAVRPPDEIGDFGPWPVCPLTRDYDRGVSLAGA
jgi:hypothetical protein